MLPRLKFTGLAIAALVLSLTAPLLSTAYFPLPVRAQTSTNSAAKAEADRLLRQGNQQYDTSRFDAAFQSWQQALQIYRAIKDRRGEGNALDNMELLIFL
jgi:hypothetical protein